MKSIATPGCSRSAACIGVNAAWTLRAGVGFDESPVVDAFRDTGVPDKDRYMVGVGFGYNITPSVQLDVGYAHYFASGHATMNESVNRIEPITGADDPQRPLR